MKTLYFSQTINASVKKVWEVMLSDNTYRQWADVFMKGSHFVGTWKKGNKILFLAPNDQGVMGGMVSSIADCIPHELISIKHLGLVTEGIEDTTSAEAKKWIGYEKYRFIDSDGTTKLQIEVDSTNDFAVYMKETWPKALHILKELAEK